MQIKNIDLLELFLKTICQAAEGKKESIFHQQTRIGLDEQQAATLYELQGNHDSILDHLAEQYESDNLSELAFATRKIASALEEHWTQTSNEQGSQQRLLDYVYPVV